jgi:hypothetical protein
MLSDYRIPALSVLAGGGLLYIIFLMPPLTSSDASLSSEGVSEAEVAAIRAEERAFCQAQPEAVDCQCFAQRSGAVRSYSAVKVPGAVYADQQELARGQAISGC